MPRPCTIARLSVRNPGRYPLATINSIDWMADQAATLEHSTILNDEGPYTARRLIPALADGTGGHTQAKLRVVAPGALSSATRKRIAKWLRSRAQYLSKHAEVATVGPGGWFTQEFSL